MDVYNFRVSPPMKYKCDSHEEIVKRAVHHWNHKWPKELWTGVMFFEGERITKEEFMRYAA